MSTHPALFDRFPDHAATLPWVCLGDGPTPVHPLARLGRQLGHAALHVKREDRTHGTYGGNKVRNLEFLLGEARAARAERVVTLAPVGSNFAAALAAQAPRVSLPVEIAQFAPARSPQIQAHARFAAAHGATLHVWDGRIGVVPAAAKALALRLQRGSYWIAPGGSSATGVLGPLNAALELARQVRSGATPAPDVVVLGVGTCGTMAGLMAGFAVSGLAARVVGIRCVDRLVCRRDAVARLANQALGRLGIGPRFRAADVDLRDGCNREGYGRASAADHDAIRAMSEEEGIRLDTTYTAKTVCGLQRMIADGELRGRSVLYWHTFSPAAIEWQERRSATGTERRPVSAVA